MTIRFNCAFHFPSASTNEPCASSSANRPNALENGELENGGLLACWLVGWLAGWQTGRLAGWLAGRKAL